jgi:hypothetical protein
MGELSITITDLSHCVECERNNAMIFQNEKNEKWWIACGYRKCEHRTKEYVELLDACSEWGLKPEVDNE